MELERKPDCPHAPDQAVIDKDPSLEENEQIFDSENQSNHEVEQKQSERSDEEDADDISLEEQVSDSSQESIQSIDEDDQEYRVHKKDPKKSQKKVNIQKYLKSFERIVEQSHENSSQMKSNKQIVKADENDQIQDREKNVLKSPENVKKIIDKIREIIKQKKQTYEIQEVKELFLDELLSSEIPVQVKQLLEKQCPKLQVLGLRNCNLNALSNLPYLLSLQGLDLANNKLSDQTDFSPISKKFPNIKQILLENNLIKKLQTVYKLSQNKDIIELDFQGNQVTQFKKYRISVVDKFKSLLYLDDERVSIKTLNAIKYQSVRPNKTKGRKKKRQSQGEDDSSLENQRVKIKKQEQEKIKKIKITDKKDPPKIRLQEKQDKQLKVPEKLVIASTYRGFDPNRKRPKNRCKTTYRKGENPKADNQNKIEQRKIDEKNVEQIQQTEFTRLKRVQSKPVSLSQKSQKQEQKNQPLDKESQKIKKRGRPRKLSKHKNKKKKSVEESELPSRSQPKRTYKTELKAKQLPKKRRNKNKEELDNISESQDYESSEQDIDEGDSEFYDRRVDGYRKKSKSKSKQNEENQKQKRESLRKIKDKPQNKNLSQNEVNPEVRKSTRLRNQTKGIF